MGSNAKKILKDVLSSQNLGVLATSDEEYPYTSLVGFAASEDMRNLVFATMKYTRKYANIERDPKVSILINTSTNSADDFKDAAAVTVLGTAEQTKEGERDKLSTLYLRKFPHLQDFILNPECVLVSVRVKRFIIVTRFQDVKEIVIE